MPGKEACTPGGGWGRRWSDVMATWFFGVLVATLVIPAAPASLEAQTAEQLRRAAEQQLGRQVTDEELLQRLRDSGMSPAQMRRELEHRGWDPGRAAPWVSALEGRTDRVPPGTERVSILQILARQEAERDRPWSDRGVIADLEPEPGPPIFGRQLFRRTTAQFDPVTVGPVPPGYRVGPGDQLLLVITGDVELAYELTVGREGWVVIPDVGRAMVHGRTMDEVRELLFERLSRVYSGIRRDQDATTFFDVTLGRLRLNEIFVIGDVERPSAYAVSSLGTILTALYYAGGPSRSGSFREIHINRGGETVGRVDLYDYLVQGRAEGDVRLEHGDVIFVPVAERRVEISGAVVRPGLYELREGEDLRDLLRFAGGVEPAAELRRVQIQRILPQEERGPGRDRAILDVSVGRLDDPAREPISVRQGDRITVFAVLDQPDNHVTITGGVWRPGTYGVSEGTRLWDVIERAGGLLPDVVYGRAQVQRLQDDWTRRLIPVSLDQAESGSPSDNPLLRGRDEIFVYAARDLRETSQVSIGGWVREPGIYPYSEGMTVADLILRAGGLRTGAYLAGAEVSRLVMAQERTAQLTENFEVPLDSALVFDRSGAGGFENRPSGLSRSEAAAFELQNLDAVYVRKAPGFDPLDQVVITGEVMFPGPYSISSRGERLSELVERAGGLTDAAYVEGFQLWRARDEDIARRDDPARERARLAGPAGLPEVDEGMIRELERRIQTEEDPQVRREMERVLAAVRDAEGARGGADVPGRTAGQPAPGQTRRTRVGIDFREVSRDPDGRSNVLVQPRDSIHVPGFIPTVDVRGAVAAPTKVLYRPGASLNYYIRQAGGYVEQADEDRVRVQFANGEVATRGRSFLFLGGGIARPDPGSVIIVPEADPRDGIQFREVIGVMTSTATAIAALLVAFSRF
jgi:protein involved in polysaccharide export with SLBB domain